MTQESTPADEDQPRDTAYWAQDAATLRAASAPTGALNLNVDGRRAMSPLQGFGQLWQKTFRIRLNGAGVTPAEVITTWKERFGEFWPRWDRFYPPLWKRCKARWHLETCSCIASLHEPGSPGEVANREPPVRPLEMVVSHP